MKKLLLILAMMALPLTANAQTPPKHVPEATVQAAIKEFADPWCKTGYTGLVDNVRNCFLNTDKESPDMDKCMLGHIALNGLTKALHKQSLQTGEKDPTTNIEFVSNHARDIRGINALSAQRYQKTIIDPVKYLLNSVPILEKSIIIQLHKCPKN